MEVEFDRMALAAESVGCSSQQQSITTRQFRQCSLAELQILRESCTFSEEPATMGLELKRQN
jgi:hypothetical protein